MRGLHVAAALLLMIGHAPAAAQLQDWTVPQCGREGEMATVVTLIKVTTDLHLVGSERSSMYVAVCDDGANECSEPPLPDQGARAGR